MASEQLTASQYVVDIYGHCGHTVINEYASGGDADRLHKKYPRMSWFQKLGHARDLARGLADVHNLIDGQAAIIHGGKHYFFVDFMFPLYGSLEVYYRSKSKSEYP